MTVGADEKSFTVREITEGGKKGIIEVSIIRNYEGHVFQLAFPVRGVMRDRIETFNLSDPGVVLRLSVLAETMGRCAADLKKFLVPGRDALTSSEIDEIINNFRPGEGHSLVGER